MSIVHLLLLVFSYLGLPLFTALHNVFFNSLLSTNLKPKTLAVKAFDGHDANLPNIHQIKCEFPLHQHQNQFQYCLLKYNTFSDAVLDFKGSPPDSERIFLLAPLVV